MILIFYYSKILRFIANRKNMNNSGDDKSFYV